jgi:type VI protein secretion system component VasF
MIKGVIVEDSKDSKKMEHIQTLETLCAPIFTRICEYWQIADMGGVSSLEAFRGDITGTLQKARAEASQDLRLEREFAVIERPLVFFIDYMVKEGKFLFRDEWREIARDYNELSGDEKFFDLLNEALNAPDAENSALLFYIMLGLGFDGVYRSDRAYIRRCMEACAALSAPLLDVSAEPIISEDGGRAAKKAKRRKKRRSLWIAAALAASFVFMAVCFIINFVTFSDTTVGYREVLNRTAQDAVPKTIIQSYDPSAVAPASESPVDGE